MVVETLLAAGADVNLKDIRSATDLHAPAFHGFRRIVELLLGAGVDVNVQTNTGRSALHEAGKRGHTKFWRCCWPLGQM